MSIKDERFCPACHATLALDEVVGTCIECSGEFGPCCMDADGICTACSEDDTLGDVFAPW